MNARQYHQQSELLAGKWGSYFTKNIILYLKL